MINQGAREYVLKFPNRNTLFATRADGEGAGSVDQAWVFTWDEAKKIYDSWRSWSLTVPEIHYVGLALVGKSTPLTAPYDDGREYVLRCGSRWVGCLVVTADDVNQARRFKSEAAAWAAGCPECVVENAPPKTALISPPGVNGFVEVPMGPIRKNTTFSPVDFSGAFNQKYTPNLRPGDTCEIVGVQADCLLVRSNGTVTIKRPPAPPKDDGARYAAMFLSDGEFWSGPVDSFNGMSYCRNVSNATRLTATEFEAFKNYRNPALWVRVCVKAPDAS